VFNSNNNYIKDKYSINITITTITHLLPLSGLPATLLAQQFFIPSQKLSTKYNKEKKSAKYDTKEIKMKIQYYLVGATQNKQ